MSHHIQPPESDLIGLDPQEAAGDYRINTTHTHYFGFQIPEAGIGCYSYIRYMPYFPLTQGNVIVFQGTDNQQLLDIAHLDYRMVLPWPTVKDNVIETTSGYRIEFLELGRSARITYKSPDGRCAFELLQEAISPLVGRAAVLPGEDQFTNMSPGGSEQFMRCTGELSLHGTTYDIDCHTIRDRSWNQDRGEDRRGRFDPPVSWTPVWFGEDLYFNQVGFESVDTEPAWQGLVDAPPDGYPGFLFGFVGRGPDDLRQITRVRRNVTKIHPSLYFPLRQEIEATDEAGDTYALVGEAIAHSPIVAWPHAYAYDSVVRWETSDGRVGYGPCQGLWYEGYQHAMKSLRQQNG